MPAPATLGVFARRKRKGEKLVVLTAYDLPHLQATVQSTGANALVQKPYDPETLIERMARLIAA